MRPDAMVLSAYLDGEVPERFVPEIETAIERDPDVRATYERLLALRSRLDVDLPFDVAESSRRSWNALMREAPGPKHGIWRRRVAVPLPLLAAAAAVVVVLIGALLWSALPQPEGPTPQFARGSDIDLTFRVDGTDMERVLQWLVDKNMLGEVNIQLPEQRFQIVGEPVFVRPAQYEGGQLR